MNIFRSLNLGRPKHQPETPPGLTPEHVAWSYRLLLDREPESQTVLNGWLNACQSTESLRREFMHSYEFRSKNADLFYATAGTIVIRELPNGVRMFVDLSDWYVSGAVVRGVFEPSETRFVESVVKAGDVVVDIGANIGYFTMVTAHRVGPSGHIYAFEPVDSNFDLLTRSVRENRFEQWVTAERAAISDVAGDQMLVLGKDRANSGGGHLVASGDTGGDNPHDLIHIKTVVLDDYPLKRPVRFVKIDVEGAELLALRGAARVLAEDRPTILSEINVEQLQMVSRCTPAELLKEVCRHGYNCFYLADGAPGERVDPENVQVAAGTVRSVVFLPA